MKNLLQIRKYHHRIIDHYENPRNVGIFDKKVKNIGTGLVGAPACGDVMKLQIKVENDTIVDAKFKTYGCGSAIASSSYATEFIKGKTLDEAIDVSNKEIACHLKLSPVKLHCSMLAEEAIKSAIKNYKDLNPCN
jgi:nitrogen fixation NifU-like protein